MLAAKPHRWPLFPDSLQEYPLLNSMTCAEKDAALFSRHIEEPSVSSTKDQFTMQDPRTQYPQPDFERQPQSAPGLAKEMNPKP